MSRFKLIWTVFTKNESYIYILLIVIEAIEHPLVGPQTIRPTLWLCIWICVCPPHLKVYLWQCIFFLVITFAFLDGTDLVLCLNAVWVTRTIDISINRMAIPLTRLDAVGTARSKIWPSAPPRNATTWNSNQQINKVVNGNPEERKRGNWDRKTFPSNQPVAYDFRFQMFKFFSKNPPTLGLKLS